jgi:hypothetical protein
VAAVPVTPMMRSDPTKRSPRLLATAGALRLRAAPVSISTRKRCCARRAHTMVRLFDGNATYRRGISRHDQRAGFRRTLALSARPDDLVMSSVALEYCSYVQYNCSTICGVYKPSSGMLSARPMPVDGTQSDAWGPVLCPACSAPTLRRLLPRPRLCSSSRAMVCRVAATLHARCRFCREHTEPAARERGWGTTYLGMCATMMRMSPGKLRSLARHPWGSMAEGSQCSEALDTMVCLL